MNVNVSSLVHVKCESCDFSDTSDDLLDELITVEEELILAEEGPLTRTTDVIKGSWTTVKKYGDSFMHTRLTTITPGVQNKFKVDDKFQLSFGLRWDSSCCAGFRSNLLITRHRSSGSSFASINEEALDRF